MISIAQRLEDDEKAFAAHVKAFKGHCHSYGEFGHKKSDHDCRDRSSYQTNSDITCHFCRKNGHVMRNCNILKCARDNLQSTDDRPKKESANTVYKSNIDSDNESIDELLHF